MSTRAGADPCSVDSFSTQTTAAEQSNDGGKIETDRGLPATHPTIPGSSSDESELNESVEGPTSGVAEVTNAESTQQETPPTEQSDDIGKIEVDRGLLSVEITIPASLASEGDFNQFISGFTSEGIDMSDARRNPDGSITYKMSRENYGRLMTRLRSGFVESFKEAAEEYDFLQSITFNNDLTKFDITVEREAYDNSFVLIGFLPFFAASIYAAFDGRNPEGMRVEINYIDNTTGQIFNTWIP
jgi:hypothetical protein